MASRRKNRRWLAFAGVLAIASAGILGWAIPNALGHDYLGTIVSFALLVGFGGALTAAAIAIIALVRLQRQSSATSSR